MEGLFKPLYELEKFNLILRTLRTSKDPVMISGLFDSQKAHLISAIINEINKSSIFITHNELTAKKIYEDFKLFFKEKVLYYPSKELIPYNIEAESNNITAQRINVLDNIISNKKQLVILSVEALQNRIIPPEIFRRSIKYLKVGEKYLIKEISEFLTSVGYHYSHMVESKGQFSIRGEIIDIFPTNEANPIRIDFFDEEIDSIKTFDIVSQRSIENMNEVKILPVKELIFDKQSSISVINNIKIDLQNIQNSNQEKYYSNLKAKVYADIERIENNINFAGIDKYISYFYNETSLLDYFSDNCVIFIDEFNKIQKTAEIHFNQFSEIIKDGIEKGNVLPQTINSMFEFNSLVSRINTKRIIHINSFIQNIASLRPAMNFSIESRPLSSFNGNINLLIDDIKNLKNNKKRIIVLAGSKLKCEKLSAVFYDNGIENHIIDNLNRSPKNGEVIITQGSMNKGFEYSLINFVVVCDKEIFGDIKTKKRRINKIGQKIKTFRDLEVGDYVVHHIHGIGQYLGIEKLKVEGIIKDYFKIKYLQGDLFVPVSQLDLIQKYIGSEARQPKINKLGGADWQKAKSKVKASVEELAKKLIRLYAEREMLKGYAFPADTVWQKQFEETFDYQETSDQLQCIKEVKNDMQKPKPMDRLLCGDVGYGKTEVAIRAAFKAVMGGKQVAYLVPTTILAGQQFNSFEQRMRNFPVKVEMISRFRTPKQQQEIIKKLKEGLVDIVIGTHRILSKDIGFKDLGLIIVDEEQRFGVSHKEKLKALKKNVDVLTLTATPIPRTLHMAMVGVRDMSVIEEPPEERFPIQTFVLEHDDEIVKDGIIKEIGRGGQVFYLHNRVSTIHKVATTLKKQLPEARIIYAHGQMSKIELEDIITRFINGEFDVLVCTTIIETGIDMPNVNTIIIEDADKMGLAQLYQLRGRVGRSYRQAYAYFTFRKDKVLSEEAEKRLKAIKDFTEFGSGFKIAMRDLEIRGAGNIIGPEQHGHMNSVGYEMYCRILEDTIKELSGQKVEETIETSIDINISSYIDDKYISDSLQKINMYKKIASIITEDDVLDIIDELLDRYGKIPVAVNNLIKIAYIKSLSNSLRIINVAQKNDTVIFTFNNTNAIDIKLIGEISNIYKGRILFTASNNPYITYKTKGIPQNELLDNIKIMLQKLNNLHDK